MLKGFDEDIAGLELSDEVKAKLIESANARAAGLVSKNEELLGKLASSKTAIKDGQGAAEKLAAMEALQAQKELEAKQNYDAALDMVKTKSQKELDELQLKVKEYETRERNATLTKGITDALTEARVNPLHMDYVLTYFKQMAQLTDGKITVGDESLSDAIKNWSETDSGKAVRLAPENNGGGASGGKPIGPGSGGKLTADQQRAKDINTRLGIT
jgi:hypothetical protein